MNSIEKALQVSSQKTEAQIFRHSWEIPSFYAEWLSQTYHFVKYTTRLLSMAASLAKPKTEDQLHFFYLKHLPEEHQHEVIIIRDVEKLGLELSDESIAAFQMVENHKKALLNQGCAAHLGYMLYLENLSITVGSKLLGVIQSHYSQDQYRFLKSHTQDDVEHVRGALSFCNELDMQQRSEIEEAIYLTSDSYLNLLEQISIRFQQRQQGLAS